jgi:Zinc carboxypeptidase
MTMYIQKSVIVTSIFAITTFAGHALASDDGYMNNQKLDEALKMVAESNDHAWIQTIGTSLGGRSIELITLAGSKEQADLQPAILITAGIDGRHLVGTEMAIRIASSILVEHSDVLDSMTIYIIPRANPDGAERNFESLTMGSVGNNRVVDDDRDRNSDEDGPDDLNGDGFITMMRRLNPPIEEPATHLADPEDPRLSIQPDVKEGQRASFTLYTEGIDNDRDGVLNEDGFGYVDLNQNFMHRWPEYEPHSGRYPLSEPESMALARFVLDHDNIVMALTLGRHDNLVNLPDSKKKDISGRAPKEIDAKDADLYKHAGELFKEATGQKNALKAESAGGFQSWLYAQRGIPSFATVVWGRPDPSKDDANTPDEQPEEAVKSETDETGLKPSGIGDIAQVTIDELMEAFEEQNGEPVDESMISMVTPEMVVQFAAQAGIVVQRVLADEPEQVPAKKKGKKNKSKSEDAKWLEYFEQAGINGFVEWEPFEHPTLGAVEIGGFLPLSRINPPAEELDELGEKETDFVLKLMGARPSVSVVGPEIKELAGGLYEVRIALVNDGEMPTSTVFSQTSHTIRPMVMRLSSSVDDILTGQRISRIWGIDANGGRSEHRWIIRSDDINTETIELVDPRFGNQTIELGS